MVHRRGECPGRRGENLDIAGLQTQGAQLVLHDRHHGRGLSGMADDQVRRQLHRAAQPAVDALEQRTNSSNTAKRGLPIRSSTSSSVCSGATRRKCPPCSRRISSSRSGLQQQVVTYARAQHDLLHLRQRPRPAQQFAIGIPVLEAGTCPAAGRTVLRRTPWRNRCRTFRRSVRRCRRSLRSSRHGRPGSGSRGGSSRHSARPPAAPRSG